MAVLQNKQIGIRAEWTKEYLMALIGYTLITDNYNGQCSYSSDGSRKDGYGYIIAKGNRLINIDYTNDRDVIVEIKEDGGTRTVFHGLIRSSGDLARINSVLV